VGVVIFFVSILVHELGHALVARRFDIATSSIELWGLGGFARLERDARTPRAEGWIAAAGPLASAGLGLLGLGVAFAGDRLGLPTAGVALAGWLGVINLVLAVFRRRTHRAGRAVGPAR
jgi:Zn-dependent protease